MSIMTVEEVRKIIEEGREDNTIPKKIVEVLKPYNGKKFTVRHEKELQEKVGPLVRLMKKYGWSELNWGNGSSECASIMLARTEKFVEIDTDWILKENARWFSALDGRNARRDELLSDPRILQKAADIVNDYRQARRELEAFFTTFNMNEAEYRLKEAARYRSG
jgi:hypothetical protein